MVCSVHLAIKWFIQNDTQTAVSVNIAGFDVFPYM